MNKLRNLQDPVHPAFLLDISIANRFIELDTHQSHDETATPLQMAHLLLSRPHNRELLGMHVETDSVDALFARVEGLVHEGDRAVHRIFGAATLHPLREAEIHLPSAAEAYLANYGFKAQNLRAHMAIFEELTALAAEVPQAATNPTAA